MLVKGVKQVIFLLAKPLLAPNVHLDSSPRFQQVPHVHLVNLVVTSMERVLSDAPNVVLAKYAQLAPNCRYSMTILRCVH